MNSLAFRAYRRLVIAHQRPVGGYPLAFLRFAQYALTRFDMAFLAAALHGFRFRLALALGVVFGVAFGLG